MATLAVGSIMVGVAADRPTAGTKGRLYFASDTKVVSYDNGSSWAQVASDSGSLAAIDDTLSIAMAVALSQ